MSILWAIKETCNNKSDGHLERFQWRDTRPILFTTRAEAREYITERYGEFRDRSDPSGWRFPKPVKVMVQLHETS
jgi:hypothetical protein